MATWPNTQASCLNWPKGLTSNGYGALWIGHKMLRAHRASYETFVGPIPSGMVIMHVCDNKRCFNPRHLIIGTQSDNMKDMVSKGRHVSGSHKMKLELEELRNASAPISKS